MNESSPEKHTSPSPSSPQQATPSRPIWKRALPASLAVLCIVALYLVVQAIVGSSHDNGLASAGKARAIQLDVLNGSGQAKIAQRVTDYLRARGFDVVEMGNYKSSDLEATVVLDRSGNLEAARKVASSIGVPADRVKQQIDKSMYLDVSVVIGKDYARLKAFQ